MLEKLEALHKKLMDRSQYDLAVELKAIIEEMEK